MERKIKIIDIDTNGSNANKFKQNLELFDLITPKILFLIDDCNNVFMAEDIDWVKTRPYFNSDNNGHCIYFKGSGYTAAYEFSKIGVELEGDVYATSLSELCDELAELHKIESWLGIWNTTAQLPTKPN